jgi:hypothetical protein
MQSTTLWEQKVKSVGKQRKNKYMQEEQSIQECDTRAQS